MGIMSGKTREKEGKEGFRVKEMILLTNGQENRDENMKMDREINERIKEW